MYCEMCHNHFAVKHHDQILLYFPSMTAVLIFLALLL